jgi:hypothetical protein
MTHMLKTAYVLLGVLLFMGSMTLVIMGVPVAIIVMVFIMMITAPLPLRKLGWINPVRRQRTLPPASAQFWHQ